MARQPNLIGRTSEARSLNIPAPDQNSRALATTMIEEAGQHNEDKPTPRPIQCPAIILAGATGSGKTWSLSTIVEEAGLDLFVVITEPGGIDTLLDVWGRKNLPIEKLHYCYIPPIASKSKGKKPWNAMLQTAQAINRNSYESLAEMKMGIDKSEYTQFIDLINTVANFKCDRTHEEFGDVTDWGPDRCFAIDSLSGVNDMARYLLVGGKPTMHQGEWGTVMETEYQLITTLTAQMRAMFVLIAHLDRVMDETTGFRQIQADFLGQKLAPRAVRYFTEVVLAKKSNNKGELQFRWSVAENQFDLKNRGLAFSNDLPPSFGPIWSTYLKRCETAGIEP